MLVRKHLLIVAIAGIVVDLSYTLLLAFGVMPTPVLVPTSQPSDASVLMAVASTLGVAGATCVSVFVSSNAYAHLAYGTVVVCVAVTLFLSRVDAG